MDFDAQSLADRDDGTLLERLRRLLDATRTFCDLCNVETTGLAAFDSHRNGGKHKAVVKARCLHAEIVAARGYRGFHIKLAGASCVAWIVPSSFTKFSLPK